MSLTDWLLPPLRSFSRTLMTVPTNRRRAIDQMVSRCVKQADFVSGLSPRQRTTWPAAMPFDGQFMTTRPASEVPPEQLLGAVVRMRSDLCADNGASVDAGTCLRVTSVEADRRTVTLRLSDGLVVAKVPIWNCDLVMGMP